MVVYRNGLKSERFEIIGLANNVFNMDAAQLIPKVYVGQFPAEDITKVAVTESDQIVAQVAVLPQVLHIKDESLPVNYVGTVSVHPDYRGQNHMKHLMQKWLNEMAKHDVMSVLSGQRQRYEYFGYTVAGMEYAFNINHSNIRHALKNVDELDFSIQKLESDSKYLKNIAQAVQERDIYIERKEVDLFAILHTFDLKAYNIFLDGIWAGYFLANDELTAINELYLDDEEKFLSFLKYFMNQASEKGEVEIVTAAYEIGRMHALAQVAENYSIRQNVNINILQFKAVIHAYLSYKHAMVGLSEGRFSAYFDGQPLTIEMKDKHLSVKSTADDDAPRLGKLEAQALILTPFANLNKYHIPSDWFPLPIFWHTADKF